MNRRLFLGRAAKAGLATATASLWSNSFCMSALAQAPQITYRAIVIVTMPGGNDGNNMIVPIDPLAYQEYCSIRGPLALPLASLIPLASPMGSANYGLHPSLKNVASFYNQQRAAVAANVGAITCPTSRASIQAGMSGLPDILLSHPDGVKQWESASSFVSTLTGWGGRIADIVQNESGSLPPVLNAGVQSIFTVGATVQGVAVQGGGAFRPLSPDLQHAIDVVASSDVQSSNRLVSAAAVVRRNSLAQQAILNQAAAYRNVGTTFPQTGFGSSLKTIAQIIAGQPVTGAAKQIFYCQQGQYDNHSDQLGQHAACLAEFDGGVGAFFQALDELGLADQVLLCTHSDFNRTYAPNSTGGSDHAWGNHQLLVGGLKGGRILGTMPTLELNGSDDWTGGLGVWVPTTSVTQLTAGIGSWLGLSNSQVRTVFPELQNFPAGPVSLT